MGGASNSPISIIQLPVSGVDNSTNPLSLQRYYYKANLVILVTNTVLTNVIKSTPWVTTNVITTVMLKQGGSSSASMFDASPLIVSFTNNLPNNTNPAQNVNYTNFVNMTNTWLSWFGANNWLSTNATFFDSRQNQTNLVTQIDVGKFGSWIATNTNCLAKWNAANPFNGVVYVADTRTTNGMYMDCVRLTNGQFIPTVGASNVLTGSGTNTTTNNAYPIAGLSVATMNPLYIAGYYNCPSTNVGTTNTVGTVPCSVICDALTILSPSWQDGNSWAEVTSSTLPTASSDTVNTAIIAGNVPSTGTTATTYSGGVHNLTRLLEAWSGYTLTLNTSIINLYPSQQATVQFQQPSAYYSAPTRQFSFDLNFMSSTNLPPGTPAVNRMIRATWSTPPPDNVAYVPSPTLSFVPQ